MNLQYTFDEYQEGCYRCFLAGEFIGYTNHTDEHLIDIYLKEEYNCNSRLEFIETDYEELERRFNSKL